MKKIVAVLMLAAMLFAVGCGNQPKASLEDFKAQFGEATSTAGRLTLFVNWAARRLLAAAQSMNTLAATKSPALFTSLKTASSLR